MVWSLLEAAMKGVTFAGVVAAALMLARPARRLLQARLALALGLAGVLLMVLNAALEATLAGLLVDGLYASAAFALLAWRIARPETSAVAPEPAEGGEQGA